MKIKKFNVILAAVALAGGLLFWSSGSLLTSAITGTLSDATSNAEHASNLTDVSAGAETRSADPFSEVGKDVQIVSWRNYKGQVPAGVALKKWTLDGRTYYQASGPTHSPSHPSGDLSSIFSCTAFFPKEGADYDEWIIHPRTAVVHHYQKDHPKDDLREIIGNSPLPEDRYRLESDSNRTTFTFWCDKHEKPGNIVLWYKNPDGDYSFATTARHIPGIRWDNHRADRWTFP